MKISMGENNMSYHTFVEKEQQEFDALFIVSPPEELTKYFLARDARLLAMKEQEELEGLHRMLDDGRPLGTVIKERINAFTPHE